jgi:acetolactate synthase-1/2/3 large subunit
VDVLLVVGSGLNDFTTNAWTPQLRASRAFIQIDIDSGQLGKNYPIDIGLLGPVDAVLARMLEHRGPDRRRGPPRTTPGILHSPAPSLPRTRLTTTDVVLAMNELCPNDAVFTADMGEHLAVALHYLRVREEGDFLTCLGFGSMGSGIVSAMGWQLGCPHRRAYAICGDGGFLMYGSELATCVQHEIACTFVVINDARLNMVHHGMMDLYGKVPDFSTQPIDFAAMAESVGASGIVVRTRQELLAAFETTPRGPLVLDVRVDPDARLGGSQRVAALRQFRGGER